NDGLRSNYISLEQVKELGIWKLIEPPYKGTKTATKYLINAKATRNLVNVQVIDIISNTNKKLKENSITSLEDLQGLNAELVAFSDDIKKHIEELRSFLYEELYKHPKVQDMSDRAHTMINALFMIYETHPDYMPTYFQHKMQQWGKRRVICDYIAGMTDRYASKEYERLKSAR
ncbi:MAG: hypothetical protein JW725_05025, partial [Candidatus Babeliaceae bacterium]|nr:hypothetical protein [Candidatus Babeliaceae bacterium]